MVSLIVIAIIVMCGGWLVCRRRHRGHASAAPVTPEGMSPQDLALKAYAHGNTCLMAGKFAEATASFHQARELDPKRPNVADRLAEVERQQQTARAMESPNATG